MTSSLKLLPSVILKWRKVENLNDILADWVNEDFEKSLFEAVDSYDKQEKERKTRFSVENDLTKLSQQSQSNATKRNTKWVVKLFQGTPKQQQCYSENIKNQVFQNSNKILEAKLRINRRAGKEEYCTI